MNAVNRPLTLLLAVCGWLLPSFVAGQTMPNAPQLCIDGNCPVNANPSIGQFKWHPGHYLGTDTVERLSSSDLKNASTAALAALIRDTPFKGIHGLYGWGVLEPSKGQYDFSRIRAHRDAMAAIGKRLIVQIQDRNFNGDGPPPDYLLPPYLRTDPEYQGGWAPRGNGTGTAPKLWLAPVMDRQIALQAALADAFDDDPWVEIVSFEETALFNVDPPGYTQAAMATQYRRLADAVSASWRKTTVCVLTNFFNSKAELRDLIDYFISKRVCVGGPDVRPDNNIHGSHVLSGQFDGIDRRSRTPIFFHNEWRSLNGEWTVAELQRYGDETNGQHYVSWSRKEALPGLTFSGDVRPWVISNKPPTRTTCPENYRNGCMVQ